MTFTLWRNEYENDELLGTYQERVDAQKDLDDLQAALPPGTLPGYSILEDKILTAPSGILVVYKGACVKDLGEHPQSVDDLKRDAYLRHDVPRELRDVKPVEVVYTDRNTTIARGTDSALVLAALSGR